CADCRLVLDELRNVGALLRQDFTPAPSPAFVDSVMKRVEGPKVAKGSSDLWSVFDSLFEWGGQGVAIACSLFIIWSFSVPPLTGSENQFAATPGFYDFESEVFSLEAVIGGVDDMRGVRK
ncbi:MAG: hypothetical protein KDD70_18170, partial [Bdellovibrionales bacterium]|nr:hypothetical protein [Bdellovibrionales bacterium]